MQIEMGLLKNAFQEARLSETAMVEYAGSLTCYNRSKMG